MTLSAMFGRSNI